MAKARKRNMTWSDSKEETINNKAFRLKNATGTLNIIREGRVRGTSGKIKVVRLQVPKNSNSHLTKEDINHFIHKVNKEIRSENNEGMTIRAQAKFKRAGMINIEDTYVLSSATEDHNLSNLRVDSGLEAPAEEDNFDDCTWVDMTYFYEPRYGNQSESNYCFYEILKGCKLLQGSIEEFIEKNELPKDGRVSIEEVKKIEDIIKCNINVYGQELYISRKDNDSLLEVELLNQHYTFYKEQGIELPKVPYREGGYQEILSIEPYFLKSNGERIEREDFDYKEVSVITLKQLDGYIEQSKKQLGDVELNRIYSKAMILRGQDMIKLQRRLNRCNTAEFKIFPDPSEYRSLHDYLVNEFFILDKFYTKKQEESKGRLFRKYTPYTKFQRIELNEKKWLDNATSGAIQSKDYLKERNKYIHYDINSAYPACLISKDFRFPIVRGEFKHISQELFNKCADPTKPRDNLMYGIYHCKITGPKDAPFRYSKTDYYTHFDIINAKEQGFKVELYDDEINALVYYVKHIDEEGNGYSGLIYFDDQYGELIKVLYNLKQETKDKYVKILLNSIWGTLCESDKRTTKAEQTNGIVINSDEVIEQVNFDTLSSAVPKVLKSDKLTKFRYYRMKPFLLSYQRLLLARVIKEYQAPMYNVDCIGVENEIDIIKLNRFYEKQLKINRKYYGDTIGLFKRE